LGNAGGGYNKTLALVVVDVPRYMNLTFGSPTDQLFDYIAV